jgi:uncharacterized membrane protein
VIVVAAVVLVVAGATARFIRLDRPFYFHDEAATSLRLSGHTAADYRRFVAGRAITAADVARFQRPGGGVQDTVRSLAIDDPQHPPLFFVLARLWAGVVGSSISSLRAFAALFGLLVLAAGGWLTQVLFGSRRTTVVAVALLAISPFQILYSDVAREYSLWLASAASAGAALVMATRTGSRRWWATYAVLAALALYSFPNTLLLIGGHLLYVLGAAGRRRLSGFALAAGAAILAYLPWLAVIAIERGAFEAGTSWAGESVPFGSLIRSWLVVGGVGVVDDPHSQSSLDGWSALLYGAVLVVELAALVLLRARGPHRAWLFVTASIAASAGPLVAADLAFGGIRSTIPRYLAPMYLTLSIALAFLISEGLRLRDPLRRGAAAALALAVVGAAAASYAGRVGAEVWWTQDDGAAAENLAVSRLVTGLQHPLLISTGLGTLLEMSHYLRPETAIRVSVDGRPPALERGRSPIVAYGSPANGAAAARLQTLLGGIRRQGLYVPRPVSVSLACCGAGIRPIPRQLWRLEPRS